MKRPALVLSVLAVLGLFAAASVGLLVNSISDDSIGLAAAPLSAGRDLAPPEARENRADRREERREEARERAQERREEARERREEAREEGSTTTTTSGEDGEFEGESGDNACPGSSSSGSGPEGSGDD
jgi:hypothetical protein